MSYPFKCSRCKDWGSIYTMSLVIDIAQDQSKVVCVSCLQGIRANIDYKRERYGEQFTLTLMQEKTPTSVPVYHIIKC